MIKLRTALPIIALSLSSLSLANIVNPIGKQQTEVVSKANFEQAPDKFEKSNTQKEDSTGSWLFGATVAGIAGLVALLRAEHKARINDYNYAKTCERLERDYYSEEPY